ncbi:MAG TPA: Gldg family protein [Phycisphaerales bacterium]|nr:Gldg family protein [Phycisphaerales bacterium]
MGNKGLISIGALGAALVIFFAVNIVAGRAFTNTRADLTDGKLYTLSPGSRAIAKSMGEPVHLTLYLSQKTSNDLPQIKSYAQRVQEMLREFARASDGKIILSVVDPEPFSENEDKAVAAGVGALPTGRGDERLYFGLVGTNSVDTTEVIPFFDPQKEEYLEYDLAKRLFNLSDSVSKTRPVGLMTWLPLEGSEGNPMMGGRGTPEWQIHRRLKESFDLRPIATNAKEIPADIKVLVIVHPKSMSEATQYAVDQFVMRGGHVVVFVDPNCEADVPPGMNQFQAMQVPKSSELPRLLGAWGVEMEPAKIAADTASAVPVNVGQGNRPEVVRYVAFLNLDKSRRSATDPVTGQLERLFLGTAGILKKKDGGTTDVQPLMTTSKEAMVLDASKVSVFPEPKKLLAEYVPGGKELWLAVRATGKAKSAFTGPPTETPTPEGDKSKKAPGAFLAESAEPINVIVVADCDMLTDRFWINESRLGNLLLGYDEFTDNGSFVINAVDNLSGSSDLLSLRARGKFSRPFTRIEELRLDAQQKYQAKEQELQKKLADTERQINEMQQKRPDAKDTRVVLTPEQQKEIEKFRAQMVETRKELRNVKFNLDKDTRSLQNRLMALNIGLMPAVIAIFALGLAAYRTSRRAADRQTASKG